MNEVLSVRYWFSVQIFYSLICFSHKVIVWLFQRTKEAIICLMFYVITGFWLAEISFLCFPRPYKT